MMHNTVPTADLTPLLERARLAVRRTQSGNVVFLQRQLHIGHAEACLILEQMEGKWVSLPDASGHRTLLPGVLDQTHQRHPANTYWVLPGRLLAGEYPGAASQRVSHTKIQTYLDEGINAFLDLTEEGELCPYDNDLAMLASSMARRCVYKRIPIRDLSVPASPQVMTDILATLQQWLHEGRNAYVHCWGGVGRTGTVVGCFLVENGYTGPAALAHLEQLWTRVSPDKRKRHPQSPETAQQRDYVRQWKQGCSLV